MKSQDPYQKGLNAGYVLQKYAPALSKKLIDGFDNKDHPFAIAFMKGLQEYKLEQISVKKTKGKSKTKGKNKEKGKRGPIMEP